MRTNALVGGMAIVLALGSVRCTTRESIEFSAIDAPMVVGAREAADPAIAVDPESGDLLLAWVAGDSAGYHLYFARSPDQGKSWSAPQRVTDREQDIKPHAEASPRLLAGHGTIAIAWPNSIYVSGRRFPASQLRFTRSTDGGLSWQPAVTLNDDTTKALAGHTFHGAIMVAPSTIIVAWLDSRQDLPAGGHQPGDSAVHHDGDATIYTAQSNDLGATWTASNTKLWGDACPCCRVSLANAPDGRVMAAWRGHFDGNVRDPVIARLGEEPGSTTRVSTDNWVLEACPHSGPGIAIDDDNTIYATWFTGKAGGTGIYAAHAEKDGAFSAPVPVVRAPSMAAAHPSIAGYSSGALIAMNADPQGRRRLHLARIGAQGILASLVISDSDGADHPQVVGTTGRGAVVAWTEKGSKPSQVRLGIVH